MAAGRGLRSTTTVVQFTPPGSACSVQFGANITSAAPGSAQGLYLIVSDIEAARTMRWSRPASRCSGGTLAHSQPDGRPASAVRIPSIAATARFATFSDPDGNGGCCRRSRRGCPGASRLPRTTFGSVGDLAGALRRAAAAHGEHEKRTGERDEDWPDWYAAYMVAEQAGAELPT